MGWLCGLRCWMAWFDGGVTAPWIVDDGLWELVEPLLPPHGPRKRGPVPIGDRKCLQGILFVLYTDRVGGPTPGAGIRLRDDLLAASETLDRCGCCWRR